MAAPTALDLLWGTSERPRRGPRPSLSLERIVTEAISLADAEGLANLSMQHLAGRLGCAKMALYRYLPGKSELVALMIDAALGDPPEPPAQRAPTAETGLGEQLVASRTAAVGDDHLRPVPPSPVGNRRHRGRAAHRPARDGLAGDRARRAGRHRPYRPRAARRGGAAERPRPQPGPGDAAGQHDLEAEMARQVGAALAANPDRYPQVLAAFSESPPPAGRNNALDFGIDRILDGLAALIAARSA